MYSTLVIKYNTYVAYEGREGFVFRYHPILFRIQIVQYIVFSFPPPIPLDPGLDPRPVNDAQKLHLI